MGGVGSGVHNSKSVEQLDYVTGEVIDEYKTITDAALDNWLDYSALSRALIYRDGRIKQKELWFRFKEN